jgi:hypothetical protein
MIFNEERAELSGTLGKTPVVLEASFGRVNRYEKTAGMNFVQCANHFMQGDAVTVSEAALFLSAFVKQEPELTYEQAGDLIMKNGMTQVIPFFTPVISKVLGGRFETEEQMKARLEEEAKLGNAQAETSPSN